MMNMLEEAIIFSTIMHQGNVRKFENKPYILHSLEVAQILSTMTNDQEIITAGILHDIVEDTDGTLENIEKRFGKRVAELVASESENQYPGENRNETWKRRKEESLLVLKNTHDIGVQMLWLADKLSNLRSLSGIYSEKGEALWSDLHQSNPESQLWYYKSIAQYVELSLNKTGAFKEYIKHINFIWPGTFDSEKARYKKYKEVSIDGCTMLGRGAKGDVYRYDDELVIKVYNQNNTYHDVENEIALSRKAFILGIPTAISFGIVSVGNKYGSMYELVDSDTLSKHIARSPGQIETYANMMSELARLIHGTKVSVNEGFPDVKDRLREYVNGGIAYENEALANKILRLIEKLPSEGYLVHGDFHSGNVFIQDGEPLLIDMDRIAIGHPIAEISDLYYFYVILGEDNPSVVEKFMGFSYQTAVAFFDSFLKNYLGTEEESRLQEVKEKAALLCYARLVRKLSTKGSPSPKNREKIEQYIGKASWLVDKLETLEF